MPVTQEQISDLNQTSRDAIELAFKLNNETIDELAKFQNNSRHRWNNLEKEVTPVLTIVLWSLVITSIVGIAIMAFQLIIICFRLAKMNAALQAARPDRDNTLFKDVMILTSKVAALESELLLLRPNTCTELQPARQDVEVEDVD